VVLRLLLRGQLVLLLRLLVRVHLCSHILCRVVRLLLQLLWLLLWRLQQMLLLGLLWRHWPLPLPPRLRW
jgi:hypothetical protein